MTKSALDHRWAVSGRILQLHRLHPMRGATLLEVMVAITIAGMLLATVGGTIVHRSDADEVANLVERTRSVMARAQAGAIRSGRPQTVEIGSRKSLGEVSVHRIILPEGFRIRLVGARGTTALGGTERAIIEFFEDGTSTGGSITLGRGAFETMIRLNWMTGHVQE